MNTTLHPRVKQDFQDAIEADKDFGGFKFSELWKSAAFQYQANKAYYDALTDCPMRTVAEDLAAHFDALEESHYLAQWAWPTQEDWADYWMRSYMDKLRFPMRGRS